MQMNRRTLLWAVITILFIITLFIAFKAGAGGAISTGQAVGVAQGASNAMVGGC